MPYERFIRHRLRLPYGRWITEDGTRFYSTANISRSSSGGPAPNGLNAATRTMSTALCEEAWFYTDSQSP